jgi:hypothetical protein
MGGYQPQPLGMLAPGSRHHQVRLPTGLAPADPLSSPLKIVFKRGDRKIIDINPILGLELTLQMGHQGLDLFPVVTGIKVFFNHPQGV